MQQFVAMQKAAGVTRCKQDTNDIHVMAKGV